MGQVTIKIDRNALGRRIEEEKKAAAKKVAEQILGDCDQYVPRRSGELKDSAITRGPVEQPDGNYNLEWDTPYAAYQYYGCWPDGSHVIQNHDTTDGSSLATTQWVEAAKRVHGKDWLKAAKQAIKEQQKG